MTAAVASALAAQGIACNIVAAAYHDHLFVPLERGEDAMRALHALQCDASQRAASESAASERVASIPDSSSTPMTSTTLDAPAHAVSPEPAQ